MCRALALREDIRLAEMNFGACRSWRGGGSGRDRIGLLLIWELYVDESRESLHRSAVLRVVEEVSMAALEFWIPVDDVELLILLRLRHGSRGTPVVTVRRSIKGVGGPRLCVESHVASVWAHMLEGI